MRKEILVLIARQFWVSTWKAKAVYGVLLVVLVLLFFGAVSGVGYYDQNHFRADHQQMARESWEANPDKHPHRMAHFGSFAFRVKHPLSIFDFGLESFTGNAVFLEAHKQNTANFSEASLSTGLLRFGELSMAMILQTILPLIVFFIGYYAIVSDKENGTLRILLTQGATWKEILFGRTLGLFAIALVFFAPFIVVTGILLFTEEHMVSSGWLRLLLITTSYMVFLFVLSSVAIIISTRSLSAKSALVKLLGLWLLMTILIPRTAQSLGSYFHPAPTKQAFRAGVEEEVLALGDSHDPDDPLFNSIKDSVLLAHQVASVEELPFNYGGYLMSLGEKMTAEVYRKHQGRLTDLYRKQNELTHWLALVNPYLAIKTLSMGLCGVDFEAYVDFQGQAEAYRYQLAQRMNELQMKYISPDKVHGSEGKVYVVARKEWQALPDFHYEFLSIATSLKNEVITLAALFLWLLVAVALLNFLSKKAKAI